MRVLQLFIFSIIFLMSCEKDDLKFCVNLFPTTIIYDTINIVVSEAYNKNGKLSDYNVTFDEFDSSSPQMLIDSIILLNNSNALSFYSFDGLFEDLTLELDSLELKIYEDKIQLCPNRLPKSILVLDPKESKNLRFVKDIYFIKSHFTRTYYLKDNKFILPLFAIRIFTDNNVPLGGFDMTGQNLYNNVDITNLYKNLETNETLSVIKYELIFNVK